MSSSSSRSMLVLFYQFTLVRITGGLLHHTLSKCSKRGLLASDRRSKIAWILSNHTNRTPLSLLRRSTCVSLSLSHTHTHTTCTGHQRCWRQARHIHTHSVLAQIGWRGQKHDGRYPFSFFTSTFLFNLPPFSFTINLFFFFFLQEDSREVLLKFADKAESFVSRRSYVFSHNARMGIRGTTVLRCSKAYSRLRSTQLRTQVGGTKGCCNRTRTQSQSNQTMRTKDYKAAARYKSPTICIRSSACAYTHLSRLLTRFPSP